MCLKKNKSLILFGHILALFSEVFPVVILHLCGKLLADIGKQVAVCHPYHPQERSLHRYKAGKHNHYTPDIVGCRGEAAPLQPYYQSHTDQQFQLCRNHSRRIEMRQAEETYCHQMDNAFEDSQHCSYKYQHHAIVPKERNKGECYKQYARRDTACTLCLCRHILAEQTRYEVNKTAWIVSFFPLMQDEEQIKHHHKLLYYREVVK